MSIQNAHAEPAPKTPKTRDILPVQPLPISDSQPGPVEITGRHVAEPLQHKEGIVVPSILNSDKQIVPSCNTLWTAEQFPPSQFKCYSCSQTGARKKPSQFKVQENEAGLIF